MRPWQTCSLPTKSMELQYGPYDANQGHVQTTLDGDTKGVKLAKDWLWSSLMLEMSLGCYMCYKFEQLPNRLIPEGLAKRAM